MLSEDKQLNGEILYGLRSAQIAAPAVITSVKAYETKKIGLTDHNDPGQMAESVMRRSLDGNDVVAVIDHHKVDPAFQTTKPLAMLLMPWGCTASILTHIALQQKLEKKLTKKIGQLLLHAVISDTFNLKGPTTTMADRATVKYWQEQLGWSDRDLQRHVDGQFKGKTDSIAALSVKDMVAFDKKPNKLSDRTPNGDTMTISVLEITGDTRAFLAAPGRKDGIVQELRALGDPKTNHAWLFVVDVLSMSSRVVCSSQADCEKAASAFKVDEAPTADLTFSVGNYSSRKLEFLPLLDAEMKK